MSTDATSPQNVSLPGDIATLKELINTQSATIKSQQRQIEQLKHYVTQLVRSKYGPRSEKLDPNQLSLFETDVGQEESAQSHDDDLPPVDEPAITIKEHRRRGGGRNPLPDDLPREQIEHDLSDEQKLCPGCGVIRERIGAETSEQLEFIPASLKVIEHIRPKYACRHCEEHVAIAPAPPKPIGKGLPGPGLLAALVVGKYSDHLPLYRLEDVFARGGVELSRSTLCRWVLETATLFEPLYELMVRRVRLSEFMHTDDTPVPVLDRSLPHTRTGRFWIYVGDGDHPYSVYDYTPSRKRDGPVEFLNGYEGYLHADAFPGYDGIYTAGKVKPVLCWAHARRKFFEARTVQPTHAHAALAFITRLYRIEREAKALAETLDLRNPEARSAWYAHRGMLREKKSLPILKQFRAWIEANQLQVLPKSPVGEAMAYVLPRWEGFVRYCENGMLSIDNNLSERTLRPCAIGRKNWMFLGSDRGGKAAAVHYTLMASCKANEVEPFAYIRDVLNHLPSLLRSKERIDTPSGTKAKTTTETAEWLTPWLPDEWLKSNPQFHRHRSR